MAEAAVEREITVSVQRWSSLALQVRVRPSDLVRRVMEHVRDEWGPQPEDQRLMLRDIQLVPDNTLASYMILQDTVLALW